MHNLAAAVFAQACTEIARMLEVMGGTPTFAYGLPGAGDHFVTCQGGRSTRLGRLLGLGHSYAHARETMAGETLEAAECVRVIGEALPKLTARGVLGERELPLMRALANVVVGGQPFRLPLDAFY
jgi:glycerol-3-phosphate dehydrogenase (NAD(P)+)